MSIFNTLALAIYSHEYFPDRTEIAYLRRPEPWIVPAIAEYQPVSVYKYYWTPNEVLSRIDKDMYSKSFRNMVMISLDWKILQWEWFTYVYIQNQFLDMFVNDPIEKSTLDVA